MKFIGLKTVAGLMLAATIIGVALVALVAGVALFVRARAEFGRVELFFPAANSHRQYALKSAPLSNVGSIC